MTNEETQDLAAATQHDYLWKAKEWLEHMIKRQR